MNLPAWWIAVAAVLGLLLGLMLMLLGRGMRWRRGLGGGKTDRLIKTNGTILPEEWKSARVLRPWHRAQMGVYFLLVEEQLRIRPPHGFIVLGDGMRQQIDNTDDLRGWVLELAGQIRAARAAVTVPIPVNPGPGQCRPCGMQEHCGQARL